MDLTGNNKNPARKRISEIALKLGEMFVDYEDCFRAYCRLSLIDGADRRELCARCSRLSAAADLTR